jgi:organic radical activating enzyme
MMAPINPRLDKVEILTIYLGNKCNFDCNYCDRGYIKSIGNQATSRGVADEMYEFFEWMAGQHNHVQYVSLHGGEPLLFARRIDQIMEWLAPMAEEAGWKIGITTNGSLVKKHEWLFEKWSGHIRATVSYDFMFQEENRDYLDVNEMADVLNKHSPEWKWQTVIPISDPRCFSFEAIKNIVNTCYSTGCRTINVIPLRHHRGKDKFDVLIDNIDLEQFLGAFTCILSLISLNIKCLNLELVIGEQKKYGIQSVTEIEFFHSAMNVQCHTHAD